MNYDSLTYKLNTIFANGNQSFFTSFSSDKGNAVEAIEKRFSELSDKRLKLNRSDDFFKEARFVDKTYDIKVDVKIISLEKNLRTIYNYIKNNNYILNKKLYFTIAIAALEDILINGSESVFVLSVFGIRLREEDIGYLLEDTFEPLMELYKENDNDNSMSIIEISILDILKNHKELIETMNSQLDKGILLSWANRLPDKIMYDNDITFDDISNCLHLADIATLDIKLYELH